MQMSRAISVDSSTVTSCSNVIKIQHKGLLPILLWSLTSFVIIIYAGYAAHTDFKFCFGLSVVAFPLAGWLADVYIGRYKVIHYSLWLMCGSSIIYHILLVSDPFVNNIVSIALRVIVGSIMAVALSGVAANTLQFGLDQLLDSSSSDLSSYIEWYVWTYFAASLIMALIQNCFCKYFDTKVTFFIIPLLCTLSLLSDILATKFLMKEPVTRNPLKLIYQVLRYAVKNKYPRMRSAFTYWEDKPYSRIDLGKAKYGGPFTTEQVEDVKTFIRILGLLAVASVLIGLVFILGRVANNMVYHLTDNNYIMYCETSAITKYMENCYSRKTVLFFGEISVVVLVPVMKFLQHMQLVKHSQISVNIFGKLALSVFLLLLYQVLILGLELTGLLVSSDQNITCLLNAKPDDILNGNVLDLSYKWLVLPLFVSGLANYFLFKNGIQFFCSQSPYSMRGLLVGAVFYTCIVPFPISRYILIGLNDLADRIDIKYCGVWYYLSTGSLTVLYIGGFFLLNRFYSFRRRDENVHNEQMFAENYYDKLIAQEERIKSKKATIHN